MNRIKNWFVAPCAILGMLLGPGIQEEPSSEPDSKEFVCPPCGADCHDRVFAGPGDCGVCSMTLVPRSSVLQVAILLTPGTDALAIAGSGSVLERSGTMNVFTVADTLDPVRCQGFLELVPRYAFGNAPAVDVLIVPPMGSESLNDELVMNWLAGAIASSRHVLTVGSGALALGRSGLLDDADVAAAGLRGGAAQTYAPKVRLRTDQPMRSVGKILTARDGAAAIHAALELITRIGGSDQAERVAVSMGIEESTGAR